MTEQSSGASIRSTITQSRVIIGDHPRRWLGLIALGVIVSAVEVVAAVVIFFVVALVTRPDEPPSVPLLGDVRGRFAGTGDEAFFGWLALVVCVFFVLRALLVAGQTYAQHRAAQATGVELARRLLGGYLAMPYEWHLRRSSAESVRNAYDSVDKVVFYVLVPGITILSESLVVLAVVAVLVISAPLATGLAALILAPAVFVLGAVMHPRLTALGLRQQAGILGLLGVLQGALEGVREIRLFDVAPDFERRFLASRRELARTNYLRSTLSEVPRIVIETAALSFLVVFLWVGVVRSGSAASSLGVLGLFAYAVLRVLPSVNRIVTQRNLMRFGAAPLDQIVADLGVIPLPLGSVPTRLPFTESIELRDVTFRYAGADRDALSSVNLRIEAGESVGLVGPTGGGKSTLADIVVGLLSPTSGEVLIDGQPLVGRERAWQANLGVVSQRSFLLDDTLQANIAFGVSPDEVDPDALSEAVRVAQLDDLESWAPLGLQTAGGERGSRLSGGQRQRIAIARALYRRPSVLVFDEGTSALDTVTESRLGAAIAELRTTHTMLTIAHRLNTVRECDRVVLVDGGRIAAVGTFDELVRDQPRFREMVESGADDPA